MFSLAAILVVASVWFEDSAFSVQSIRKAFEEPAVSAVSQSIKLPNLTGMNYDEVQELTQTNGEYAFTLKIYEEVYSSTVPEGEITAQLPFAGSVIKAGDTVKVSVSLGASMRALPEIAGLEAEAAVEALRAEGFAPVKVNQVNSEVAVGNVIGYQSGQAGDVLAHGSVVQILISAEE